MRRTPLPEARRGQLHELLGQGRCIRAVEAHSGLSALVASGATCRDDDGRVVQFDAIWSSSLTISAAQGLPDCELDGIERRLDIIQEVLHATDRPVIVDGDTGGEPVNFAHVCARLERMGASAVVVEDKQHPKRNSLIDAAHHLADPDEFAAKIRLGRSVLQSDDFIVFARLESLIAGADVDDALARAETYLLAGADGVMIHSKARDPEPVFAFLDGYRDLSARLGFRRPVICVPTAYNAVTADALHARGANIWACTSSMDTFTRSFSGVSSTLRMASRVAASLITAS